ncbi:ABC transporter permease [Jeotgalibacillus sp. R-1-5s-1]|uniref:ABC transporter permease n=1 Tax=Jeotgalibacillus sp. R-1-5s-1 TaxID=2555897 RepID=UPI00106B1CBB|nr:ABC transporter permease [Jeotgalibacillus sp. R-1-5s-1]TFD94517.1 ABC transporter permease [Jeotgalibacillus sp. R-1-5s-1]
MNSAELLMREIKYFTNFNNKMYQFLLFFQPLVFLTITYFLGQMREGIEVERFIVASAIISMWSYVLYSSGSALVSQKWSDTLKMLVVAPVSLFSVILSKVLSNAVIALISMVITFIYSIVIFRFDLHIPNVWLFFGSVLVLVFSLSVIGLMLAFIFSAFENVFAFQNLILTPLIVLCGVFLPVESFPLFLQVLAYCIPMTWGVEAVYSSLSLSSEVYQQAGFSLLLSGVYLIVGLLFYRRIEIALRSKGNWGVM